MEPINRAERSASLFNFILVYVLITAIPVGITYQIAKKSGGSSLNQKAVSEQQTLAKEMSALQTYVKRMEEIDTQRPAETAPSETWGIWLQAAEKQNVDLKGRVDEQWLYRCPPHHARQCLFVPLPDQHRTA